MDEAHTNSNPLAAALGEHRAGHTMPRAFYTSEEIFRLELEAVFAHDWLFACSTCEIKAPGDYLTLEVGNDSVIIVRGKDGEVRAFHNTCRHRGSRICHPGSGRAPRLVCPYHQWTYDLDGRLFRARQMPPDFVTADHSLKPVHTQILCGMVYLSLAEQPPDFGPFRAAVTPYIAPHQPERTKVAFESTLVEEGNWKLVIENNRECYHCPGSHPELMRTLVEFALPEFAASSPESEALMRHAAARWDALGLPHVPADGGREFRCIRLPFRSGRVSFTPDGRPASGKLLGNLADPNLGSVRMFHPPNNWNHFLADHIVHFRVLPLSANRSTVRTTWLVHEDAVEGVDYDVERLTAVWRATNNQDRALVETNQVGIRSRAYTPGPYAPSEFMVNDFIEWYAGRMRARNL